VPPTCESRTSPSAANAVCGAVGPREGVCATSIAGDPDAAGTVDRDLCHDAARLHHGEARAHVTDRPLRQHELAVVERHDVARDVDARVVVVGSRASAARRSRRWAASSMSCSVRRSRAPAFGRLTLMDSALPQIGRNELRQRIEDGADFVLIDALAPMSYARSHLPGAINIVPEWVDERAKRRIPDRDTEVVVYCSGPDCDSSALVGERLVELGYRHVRHYPGGKSDWVEAGLPLEGGRAAATARAARGRARRS
jgi:rhodanese-related sulfurtransferase